MKNKFLTIIEIGEEKLSILQSRGSKAGEGLLTTRTRSTKGLDDAALSKTIASDVKSNKAWRAAQFCVVLPRRLFIFKHFLFPSQSESEIRKMLALQLAGHVPYKKEDTVWDHLLLEKTSDGYAKVLLIAASLEAIGRYAQMFVSQNIHPQVITLSSWGLVGWLRLAEKSPGNNAKAVHCLFHMESTSTEICLCDRERFYFSRQIGLGAQDLEKGRIPDFLEQVNLTLAAYRQEKMGPEPVRGIILSSVPAQILADNLKNACDFPLTVHDLTHDAPLKQMTTEQPKETLDSTVATGILRLNQDDLNNFLPPYLRTSRDLKAQFNVWFKNTMLLIFALVSVAMALGVEVYHKSWVLGDIRKNIQQYRPSTDAAQKRLKRWETLRNAIDGRVSVVDLFEELSAKTPPELVLTSIRLNANGELTLQGQSFNPMSINKLQSNLVNSPWLKNVTLQYATKRLTATGEMTNFLITGALQKGGPQEVSK